MDRSRDLDINSEVFDNVPIDANVGMNFPKRDTNDDSKYDPVEIPESITSPQHFQPHDRIENKKTENGDHYSCNLNGVSNGCRQGYVTEPCDAKAWDSGFVSCSKNQVDFLPTCNMIEEVYGDGLRHEMRRA
ncbi:AT-rich interactive domain-containing protein 2 [Senna tora]|uniref:AT-rich interactive domain-containing protein 2 n=1 Tax=Senna tora TaxID=362788 RepID=A0A834T156_9FABA|nr:AT-rich interactive domain-containing protein 2 [Senna tora]